MRNNYKPSAHETAILVRHIVYSFSTEKGKEVSRARISAKTLRIVSNRRHLREVFIDEWIDEMANAGWSVFPIGDGFALIQTESIDGWPRIAASRIGNVLKRVRKHDDTVFDEIESKMSETVDDEVPIEDE